MTVMDEEEEGNRWLFYSLASHAQSATLVARTRHDVHGMQFLKRRQVDPLIAEEASRLQMREIATSTSSWNVSSPGSSATSVAGAGVEYGLTFEDLMAITFFETEVDRQTERKYEFVSDMIALICPLAFVLLSSCWLVLDLHAVHSAC